MPRPTKTDDPRRTILEAARALLLKHGHRKVSLRQVAARARFSPAGLYEYFDSKEQLFAALAAQASRSLTAALFQAAQRTRQPRAALVELGLAYVRFAGEHPEDFMLMFTGLPSARRGLEEHVPDQSAYGALAGAVRSALEHEGRRPTARTVDQWAYGLWATAHGMAMLQNTHLSGFAADFEAADRQVLEVLVNGLLAAK